MPKPNIKLYLIMSGVLAVILIIIVLIPFNRRPSTSNTGSNFPTPTTVSSANQQGGGQAEEPVAIKEFTGVEEEELPAELLNQSEQKQELRRSAPLTLTTFTIDFDYTQDKFTVSLSDPKDAALREFEEWKKNNYSFIPMDQFIFN